MAVACGRIHRIELAQALVQIDRHALFHAKGAYAARRMADVSFHLIVRDHPGLDVEQAFVFVVVQLGRALRNNEHRLFALQDGQRFGNAGRRHAQRVCRFGHSRRGLVQHDDMISQTFFFQVCFCFFKRHFAASPLYSVMAQTRAGRPVVPFPVLPSFGWGYYNPISISCQWVFILLSKSCDDSHPLLCRLHFRAGTIIIK